MSAIQELDLLFQKIKDSRNELEVSGNASLEDLIKICDESSYQSSILEVFKYSMVLIHSNENVSKFLNITSSESTKLGFKFFLKVLHPENLGSFYMMIRFFSDIKNRHKTFSNTYYIKTINGWEWVYNCIKPVTFNDNGSVKYMLSVSCSLNESSDNKQYRTFFKKNLNFYEENIEKYLSMNAREKEVLKLIAKEKTVIEIADILGISVATIESDRKKLIKKFDVKNSIGLAKYAFHFKMM